MAALIASAGPGDVTIANTLDPPVRGCHAGPGLHVVIPDDWLARCMGGEAVPGCNTAYIAIDGSLYVGDTAIRNSTDPVYTKDINALALTTFVGKLTPIVVDAAVEVTP